MEFERYLSLNRQKILLILLFILCYPPETIFSQKLPVKPTRQSSLEAFANKNYEQAYTEFKELLVSYPKDPLYKYYSGVSLVNLSRNPLEAESLLKQALQSSAVIKSLPLDALFYLGRSQQMAGKFSEATGTFNQFIDQVGKKISKEYSVAGYIQQCNEKKGKISEPEVSPTVVQTIVEPLPQPAYKVVENKPAENKPSENKDTIIKKPVPTAFDSILDDALDLQTKADSLYSLASEQKKVLNTLSATDKSGLKAEIAENEAAATSFQKAADQKYNEAQLSISQPPATVIKREIRDTMKIQPAVSETVRAALPVIKNTEQSLKQTDKINTDPVIVTEQFEIFSLFEILPKPVTDPKEKIMIDTEVPPGLIYRIQIAVFRNPVAPAYFQGITPIYGFKVAGTDKTNYFAGMFRRYADAARALTSVKAKGFKDAFIVALSGNKPVSADRAALLEKEWGKKPLITKTEAVRQVYTDTIPPTLAFRVEVMRVLKPVKEDIFEGMRKMAGSRGLDTQTLEDGKIVYLIGNFITFDSAVEYTDLLIRNGYREAKVSAWLGKKEIPVDTARQLFENLQ
jgi:tetratricopeptide (TPR) repeat protein